jgi:chromosome segregation ATPase
MSGSQKTYDELAEEWAAEIEASEQERERHAEESRSMQARLSALEHKLAEYEAVLGAMAFRHSGIRLRQDEVAANHKFTVGLHDGDLVISRVA